MDARLSPKKSKRELFRQKRVDDPVGLKSLSLLPPDSTSKGQEPDGARGRCYGLLFFLLLFIHYNIINKQESEVK